MAGKQANSCSLCSRHSTTSVLKSRHESLQTVLRLRIHQPSSMHSAVGASLAWCAEPDVLHIQAASDGWLPAQCTGATVLHVVAMESLGCPTPFQPHEELATLEERTSSEALWRPALHTGQGRTPCTILLVERPFPNEFVGGIVAQGDTLEAT
jgi:hypothetical protein